MLWLDSAGSPADTGSIHDFHAIYMLYIAIHAACGKHAGQHRLSCYMQQNRRTV